MDAVEQAWTRETASPGVRRACRWLLILSFYWIAEQSIIGLIIGALYRNSMDSVGFVIWGSISLFLLGLAAAAALASMLLAGGSRTGRTLAWVVVILGLTDLPFAIFISIMALIGLISRDVSEHLDRPPDPPPPVPRAPRAAMAMAGVVGLAVAGFGFLYGARLPVPAARYDDDHPNSPDHPRDVGIGSEVSGRIDGSADSDAFRFAVRQDAAYRLKVRCRNPDDVRLSFPKHGSIGQAQSSEDGLRLEFNSDRAEPLVVVVLAGESKQEASYGICVEEIPDDHRETAEIFIDRELLGTIEWPGDVDVFGFRPPASGAFYAAMVFCDRTEARLTVRLDEHHVGVTYPFNGGVFSSFSCDPGRPVAMEVAGSVGSYRLRLVQIGADDFPDERERASVVAAERELAVRADYPGDRDCMIIASRPGARYRVVVHGPEGTRLQLGAYRPSATNTVWGTASPVIGAEGSSSLEFQPTLDREVCIEIGSYAAVTEFRVHVEESPPPPDDQANGPEGASVIPVGGGLAARIDPEFDEDWFVVEGRPEDTVRVELRTHDMSNPMMEVFDIGGGTLAKSDGRARRMMACDVRVPSSGRCHVAVRCEGSAGGYTVFVVHPTRDDHSDAPEQATPLEVDRLHAGAIQWKDDRDCFRFEGRAGVRYALESPPGTLFDMEVVVSDASGARVKTQLDGSIPNGRTEVRSFECTLDGPHFVVVSGGDPTAVGAYLIRLVRP